MSLLKNPIQKKLSAVLGAQVTIERMNVSLLGGTLDVHGISVAGADPSRPVLTVKRVRAEVALSRALRGEFVVKSLAIERPIVSVVESADGTLNLPKPVRADDAAAADDDDADEKSVDDAPPGGDDADAKAASGKWSFDVQKVLLVDGELSFRSDRPGRAGYHVLAERALAELTRAGNGYDVTCILESVGRRDGTPADLGQVKLVGRLNGAADVTKLADASLHADLDVADGMLRATVDSPKLAAADVRATAHGAVDVPTLLPLLPTDALPPALRAAGATGRVELTARGGYSASAGLRVDELVVRAADVRIGGTKA